MLAIYNRIRKAVLEGKVFRVIVLLPVHPDGTYATSAAVRNIMRYASSPRLDDSTHIDPWFHQMELPHYFSWRHVPPRTVCQVRIHRKQDELMLTQHFLCRDFPDKNPNDYIAFCALRT